MKNTILKNIMILTLVIISGAIYAQKKETVTITGKITVKDTGKPPIGIITIAEKDVVDYWAAGDFPGTYRHTFVEKDGSFKFNINKGGTITIWDGFNRYAPITLEKITNNNHFTLTLGRTKRTEKTNPKAFPPNALLAHEKKIDIHKRIKIHGKITDPIGKPIGNASISQLDVFTHLPTMSNAFITPDKNGNYSYTVLKDGRISFSAGRHFKQEILTATKDTVINLKLKRQNPFR